VFCGSSDEPLSQVCRAEYGPNVSSDAFTAEHLGGIDGSHAKTDMADIPICGKVFVSKYYAQERVSSKQAITGFAQGLPEESFLHPMFAHKVLISSKKEFFSDL
jgi:hypothetical protein